MYKTLKILIFTTSLLFLVAFGILVFILLEDSPVRANKAGVRKKVEIFNQNVRYPENAAPTASEFAQTAVSRTSALPIPQTSPNISKESGTDPVSEILSCPDEDFANTVNQLLSAMAKLNPEQQAEAAQHIANLSDDTLAAQWSQKIISQSLPQPASEVLFNDLLNRPHELLMPFLSKLADMPQHPQSTQSVEILEVLFGQPPVGSNWKKWVKLKVAVAP